MDVSDKVLGMLSIGGKKQIELAERLGMKRQNLSAKIKRNYWTADDLVEVAGFVGARLGFIFPDGSTIYLDAPASEGNKKDPDV